MIQCKRKYTGFVGARVPAGDDGSNDRRFPRDGPGRLGKSRVNSSGALRSAEKDESESSNAMVAMAVRRFDEGATLLERANAKRRFRLPDPGAREGCNTGSMNGTMLC